MNEKSIQKFEGEQQFFAFFDDLHTKGLEKNGK